MISWSVPSRFLQGRVVDNLFIHSILTVKKSLSVINKINLHCTHHVTRFSCVATLIKLCFIRNRDLWLITQYVHEHFVLSQNQHAVQNSVQCLWSFYLNSCVNWLHVHAFCIATLKLFLSDLFKGNRQHDVFFL